MTSLLHLAWVSVKGLVIYASVLGAGALSTWALFGPPPAHRGIAWEATPGIIGGGLLMGAIVLGAFYVLLGDLP